MITEIWALAGGGQQGNPMMNFVFIGIFIAIFWFFIIQPQRRQQKEHQKLIDCLKKGEKIVTQGGIHGTITNVKKETIVVRVDDSTKIEFDRQAITKVKSTKEK